MICPLCHKQESTVLFGPFNRQFYRCAHCSLFFANPAQLPDRSTEKSRYETHQNSTEDAGYIAFLNRAVQPSLPYLNSKSKVLDYGCGPGPAISFILKKTGIDCLNYDPIFFPKIPQQKFDAVISTECIEHFHNTRVEFEKMLSFLKTGGLLTLMTDPYTDETDFSEWYYLKDPTHVSLFHSDTFYYLSEAFGLELLLKPERRVYIFRKMK